MEATAAVNDHQGTAAPTAAETGVLVETTTTVVMTTLTRKVRKRVRKVTEGVTPKRLQTLVPAVARVAQARTNETNTYLKI